MTLSIGSFSQVVAFPTAPIATGWSDPCRKGLAPSQELRLSTAHGYGFASNPPRSLIRVTRSMRWRPIKSRSARSTIRVTRCTFRRVRVKQA
jgi:hypothetical protein